MHTKEGTQPRWLIDFKQFLTRNNIISTLPDIVESYLNDLIAGLTTAVAKLKDQSERFRIEKKLWLKQIDELTQSLAHEKQKGIPRKSDLVLIKHDDGKTLVGIITRLNGGLIEIDNELTIDLQAQGHPEIYKLIQYEMEV